RSRYTLTWKLNLEALSEAEREDGVFPLLTNDRKLSATEVLRAYKRQPLLEKRFSQFKTDFAVAPVYLKNVSRIQGLLAAYFFVLLVQTLLERELRQGMARAGEKSLPLYPEDRPCARPTTHRLIEVFSSIQRHEVRVREGETQVMVTKLTKNATLDHSTTGPRPEDLRAGVAECPAPEKMPGNWNDDLRKVRLTRPSRGDLPPTSPLSRPLGSTGAYSTRPGRASADRTTWSGWERRPTMRQRCAPSATATLLI